MKIKPCPYCGSECNKANQGGYYILCGGSRCTYVSGAKPTEAEAIEAHNRISELAHARVEPVHDRTCGNCMGYVYGDAKKGFNDWHPGSCNIEDVSDELPYDKEAPDWCPLHKGPVVLMLGEGVTND